MLQPIETTQKHKMKSYYEDVFERTYIHINAMFVDKHSPSKLKVNIYLLSLKNATRWLMVL